VVILFLEHWVHVDGVGYVAFTLVHGDPGTCCVAGRILGRSGE
jgi:hypothetical protein